VPKSLAPKDGLRILRGDEGQVRKLVGELLKVYAGLPWFPIWFFAPDSGPERIGCKLSFGLQTVELRPQWWGTWVVQYKTSDPKSILVRFAIHDSHPLFSLVKTIQKYGWEMTKDYVDENP